MKNIIENDRQLAELLKGSFAQRPQDEAEQLTRQIMRRLPRRRRPVLSMLVAYIQSPFWLVTAIVLCLGIFAVNPGDLLERINNPQAVILTAAVVSLSAASLANDMLRDVEKATRCQ